MNESIDELMKEWTNACTDMALPGTKNNSCNSWILTLGGIKALSLSSLSSLQGELMVSSQISSHVTFNILALKPVYSFLFFFWDKFILDIKA